MLHSVIAKSRDHIIALKTGVRILESSYNDAPSGAYPVNCDRNITMVLFFLNISNYTNLKSCLPVSTLAFVSG